MDDFLKTLDLERETMDQTADLLKSEGVVLSQILSGSVSIEDLEEVGVPKEALEKIDKGAKAYAKKVQEEEAKREAAEQARRENLNTEGFPMRYGTGSGSSTLYCGRMLGRHAIPGSDGQCGPNNGPQCASCSQAASCR